MNLGDGVLRASIRAEAIRARLEPRFEYRLEHQLQSSLYHPVPNGWDPQPATLRAAGFRDKPFPNRKWVKRMGFKISPKLQKEGLLAMFGHDRVRGLRIDSGRASAFVAPHPTPRNKKKRRVINEIEQVVEPTLGVVVRPSMQFGLDLQYPSLRLFLRRPRRADIHRAASSACCDRSRVGLSSHPA